MSTTILTANTAATAIQTFYRGYLARKAFKNQRDAAITLQAALRAFSTQQIHLQSALSFDLAEKGVALIERQNLASLPRADSGKTSVYLPKEVPIVLKHSKGDCSSRLTKMKKAREVCNKNHLNHLVIPQASIHGEFLIERRLPIAYHYMKEQMGFYYENRDQFTPAIQDMTRFLCLIPLNDLSHLPSRNHPLQDMLPPNSRYAFGRYDNVPLYVEDGHYCIGLIDLERLRDVAFGEKQGDEDYCLLFGDLIGLFPYHFDEIIAIGKQFWPEIEKHLTDLKQHQAEAIAFFEKFYLTHRQFAIEQQIDRIEKAKLVVLDPEKIQFIRQSLLGKIGSFDKEHPLVVILKSGVAPFLDQQLEPILFQTRAWLEEFLNEWAELRPNAAPDLLGLLELRTVHTMSFDLVNQIVALFPVTDLPRAEKRKAAAALLHSILDAWVEQKIIAFWQPLNSDYEQIVFC